LLSPADLLEQAEEFSSRIPAGREYEEDRNSSWLAIGQAWLKLNDGDAALRALLRVDHLRCQAVLRHAIAMWTGEHLDFEAGCTLLKQISEHPRDFTPYQLQEMVPPMHRLLGARAVVDFAQKIEDPYAASQVLVTLSHFLKQVDQRRATLECAEHFARGSGDRALRWVRDGYRAAGLSEDAARVESMMDVPPKELDNPLLAAEKALADALAVLARYEPEIIPDAPVARLRRFLAYKFNDLKVRFLTDTAMAGGVDDSEIESILLSTGFAEIDAPRAPSIYRNPCNFDLAEFLFARPVLGHEDDREYLEGSDCFQEPLLDRTGFQRRVADLFTTFGQIAPRYSVDQIDQGLWLLIGGRLYQIKFDQSMLAPFRDYYLQHGDDYSGTAFYMWWDLIRPDDVSILETILALPSAACQRAALHGLNHLRPDPKASEVVSGYIERNRSHMTLEELEYAEMCRDGRAQ
jgi:hypothetical protein